LFCSIFSVGVSLLIAQTDYNKVDERKNGVWKFYPESKRQGMRELSNMEKKLEF
jgi:hypothetical protein